ncbi:MAG: hypothetical protein RIF32_14905 [Leptospirales bacterium]|jgi:ribosomal protein L12E/L44/L45/RPP1/RPP2
MAEPNLLEALLTLDLKQASETQRADFQKSLEENGWESVEDVDHAWTATLEDMNREEAIEEIDEDLAEAAEASGARRYRAALQLSPQAAWFFEGDAV